MSNQEILDELRDLRREIQMLSDRIEKLDKSCSRMDNHINFVENTYDILRTPLNVVSKDLFCLHHFIFRTCLLEMN